MFHWYIQSKFRANSEQIQSRFRADSEQIQSRFRADFQKLHKMSINNILLKMELHSRGELRAVPLHSEWGQQHRIPLTSSEPVPNQFREMPSSRPIRTGQLNFRVIELDNDAIYPLPLSSHQQPRLESIKKRSSRLVISTLENETVHVSFRGDSEKMAADWKS